MSTWHKCLCADVYLTVTQKTAEVKVKKVEEKIGNISELNLKLCITFLMSSSQFKNKFTLAILE